MTHDTLILELWDGRVATWTGRQTQGCLYVKVVGDRYRIWMPRGLVLRAGRMHAKAA